MQSCMGKILEVDLSSGQIVQRKVPDAVYDYVLSGKGLGAWYLYRHIAAGADPMGPENVLGFVSGTLTGTGSLMCGRWMVVCKSPLTGGWGDANCGGIFSPAIKQCGVDAIFFRGISEKPVYLYMDNKTAELRDASKYWGMDATEAEEELIKDTKDKKKPAVAVIGQAGENLSLIAGICNEGGRIAARSGVGAVMGSKRLKAVVLAGSKTIQCADRDAVRALNKPLAEKFTKGSLPKAFKGSMLPLLGTIMSKLTTSAAMDGSASIPLLKKWGSSLNTTMGINNGDTLIKNWSGTPKDARHIIKSYNPDKLLARENRKYHCYSCGLGCGAVIDIHDVKDGAFSHTHKPEYETIGAFGPLLLNGDLESILYINELLNRGGMDSISAGNTIAFAIECFEEGLITIEQTDGLKLTWGNSDAIITLVKKMIKREGIGDILADGVERASLYFGENTAKYAMHIGGQEPGMHDARNDPQLGVHFVADPAPGKHTIGSALNYNGMSLSDICSWAPAVKKHKKSEEYVPSREEAMKSVANACYSMLTDAVGGCFYAEIMGVHTWNPCAYMNAANGLEKTGDEYMEIGRRIQTLRQMFNIKQGIDPASWKLPDRMAGIPPLPDGPLKGKTLQNKDMVRYHWEGMGWSGENGIPLPETLEHLSVAELLALEEE